MSAKGNGQRFNVHKNANYTVMPNCHLQERRLSLKAKGLLSVILSLPPDWDYSIAGLVAICKENETAVKSALKELKAFGYLRVTKLMPGDTESGRIEYSYDIFEQPSVEVMEENLAIEKQGIENLGVENQGQLNTNESNTNELNTKEEKTIKEFKSEFEEIWKSYPKKQGKANALKAYIKARKNGAERAIIEVGLSNYIRYIEMNHIEPRFIKQGSTWFTQECWNDEYIQTQAQHAPQQSTLTPEEEAWRKQLEV